MGTSSYSKASPRLQDRSEVRSRISCPSAWELQYVTDIYKITSEISKTRVRGINGTCRTITNPLYHSNLCTTLPSEYQPLYHSITSKPLYASISKPLYASIHLNHTVPLYLNHSMPLYHSITSIPLCYIYTDLLQYLYTTLLGLLPLYHSNILLKPL